MSGYADRCECGYVANLPATKPWRVIRQGDGVRADYWCARCGREWYTSWLADEDDEDDDGYQRITDMARWASGDRAHAR